MIDKEGQALRTFKDAVENQVRHTLYYMDEKALKRAEEIIQKSVKNGGRLHITGIGKPSHLAGYIASLITSTGTPCYYLHGTEAVHGSSGQLVEGDVVIAISNSGETSELKDTVNCVKNNECKVIAVTGTKESWLAKNSDVCLLADIELEGGPLNRAPRNSILAETIVLQSLSVMLQVANDVTPQEYIKHHPGGSLGKLRENEMIGNCETRSQS